MCFVIALDRLERTGSVPGGYRELRWNGGITTLELRLNLWKPFGGGCFVRKATDGFKM